MRHAFELLRIGDYVLASENIYGAVIQQIKESLATININPSSHKANNVLIATMRNWTTNLDFVYYWNNVQELRVRLLN